MIDDVTTILLNIHRLLSKLKILDKGKDYALILIDKATTMIDRLFDQVEQEDVKTYERFAMIRDRLESKIKKHEISETIKYIKSSKITTIFTEMMVRLEYYLNHSNDAKKEEEKDRSNLQLLWLVLHAYLTFGEYFSDTNRSDFKPYMMSAMKSDSRHQFYHSQRRNKTMLLAEEE